MAAWIADSTLGQSALVVSDACHELVVTPWPYVSYPWSNVLKKIK
jgi:hypothetical protein